jgi:hypothetical protein
MLFFHPSINKAMKTEQFSLALKWIIFLPIILPLCIVFGALRGAFQLTEEVVQQMKNDLGAASH